MYSSNHYKLRSRKLHELGFANATDFYASKMWQDRRSAFAEMHAAVCDICGTSADDLHHRTYKRLGDEQDSDLQWLCRQHHGEAHERGFIGEPTDPQKLILREHGYDDDTLRKMSFGDAFTLIGNIRLGIVETPQMTRCN